MCNTFEHLVFARNTCIICELFWTCKILRISQGRLSKLSPEKSSSNWRRKGCWSTKYTYTKYKYKYKYKSTKYSVEKSSSNNVAQTSTITALSECGSKQCNKIPSNSATATPKKALTLHCECSKMSGGKTSECSVGLYQDVYGAIPWLQIHFWDNIFPLRNTDSWHFTKHSLFC